MRILIGISVLLVGVVVGVLIALPRLVTWDDYRDQVTEQAEAITGQTVTIGGRIDLKFLPEPTLTLAQATLSSPPNTPGGRSLAVDRLDLRLKPLPLLGGRMEIDAVRLVRPVLQVTAPRANPASALLLAGGGMMLPLGEGGPSRLTVVDGRAIVRGTEHGTEHAVEAINFEVGADGPKGPYTFDGEFAIAAQTIGITARVGLLEPNAWSTLQLVLTAPGAGKGPTILSFRGLTWSDLAAPRLRGELSMTGTDAKAGIGALDDAFEGGLGGALGDSLPDLPARLSVPFRVAAHLEFVDHEAKLERLHLALADTEADGSLRLGLGPQPEIDLELGMAHLAAPDAWPLGAAGLAPLAALAGLKGRVDLSVDALDYRGGTIRHLRTTLALAGTGGLTVEQARATLPGQTSVDFTGALTGKGADAVLQGDLKVVSDDLSGLLAWSGLGLQQSGLARGRLRTLSLASRLALDPSTLRFTEAELRVDASRLSGSLALSLGARPQIAGVLALDRLDLDAYLPDGRLPPLAGPGLQAFDAFDAALEARIDRLTWHGLRFQDISLNGRSVAGQLTLSDLSLHDAAETDAHLSGELNLRQRTFDLAATLQTGRPAQLLRSLGRSPPLLLARLTPISVQATAKGKLDAFDLDLELHHDQASLALKGVVHDLDGQPTYTLTVDAAHPDYPQLLDQIGVLAEPGSAEPAPASITGKLTGDLSGQTTMVGTARLGAMSLTGQVGFQPARPRPKLTVRLSAGEPDAAGLASLVALSGLYLDPIVTQGPEGGAWSSQPLAFGWLGAVDAEVEVSAKGGLAGPGFELQAQLDQGRLMIDQLSTALWNGQLKVQTSVDAARPLPYLGLAIDLREADAAALTAWLGLPPVVQGKADLYVEATTAGDNLRDLIRGLIGDAKVTLHDGRLVGADLARLASVEAGAAVDSTPIPEAAPAVPVPNLSGSFALKRGIATAKDVRLELDGHRAELEGSVDLLLWAADLTFRLDTAGGADGHPLGLKLVGPLDRPQMRLLQPPAPTLPGQAP